MDPSLRAFRVTHYDAHTCIIKVKGGLKIWATMEMEVGREGVSFTELTSLTWNSGKEIPAKLRDELFEKEFDSMCEQVEEDYFSRQP